MKIKRKPIIIPRILVPNICEPYGYIYITANLVNHKQYIGQHKSIGLDKLYLGSGTILLKSVEKYGKENFITEPIDWASNSKELNEKEELWINFLEVLKDKDSWYNICIGGLHGPIMYGKDNPNFGNHTPMSESQKQKISLNHPRLSGKNHPLYGVTHNVSEETKHKLSIKLKGRKISNLCKEVVGARYRGESLSDFHRENLAKSCKKAWIELEDSVKEKCVSNLKYTDQNGAKNVSAVKVVQLSLDMRVITVYEYMSEANQYGFNRVGISRCCRHKQETYKGYKWMYAEEYYNS